MPKKPQVPKLPKLPKPIPGTIGASQNRLGDKLPNLAALHRRRQNPTK